MNHKAYCETLISLWHQGVLKKQTFKVYGREFKVATLKDVKKYIKAIIKNEYPYKNIKYPSSLLNMWTRHWESGESLTNVYIFKKTKNVMSDIEKIINIHGDPNHYDFSPTGLWFSSPAAIKEFNDRVVVLQNVDLDC